MTELQTMRVRALAAANLGQNRRAVSFVADLGHIADRFPDRKLSDRQAGYLVGLCWSFRRQIPAALRPAQNPYESHLWSQRADDGDSDDEIDDPLTAEELNPQLHFQTEES